MVDAPLCRMAVAEPRAHVSAAARQRRRDRLARAGLGVACPLPVAGVGVVAVIRGRAAAGRGDLSRDTPGQRVARLRAVARQAVVAPEGHAGHAPQAGIARLDAVADVAIVALGRRGRLTAQRRVAPADPAAEVAGHTAERRARLAPRGGIAALRAVADVAVVARQRRAGHAPEQRAARLGAVARVAVVTEERVHERAGPGRDVAGPAPIARVAVVAVRVARAAAVRRVPDHAAHRGLAGLEPIAGLTVIAHQRCPGLAAKDRVARLQAVAQIPVVAHDQAGHAPDRRVAALGRAGVVVVAIQRRRRHTAQRRVAPLEPVADVGVQAHEGRARGAADQRAAHLDPVAGVAVVTGRRRASHAGAPGRLAELQPIAWIAVIAVRARPAAPRRRLAGDAARRRLTGLVAVARQPIVAQRRAGRGPARVARVADAVLVSIRLLWVRQRRADVAEVPEPVRVAVELIGVDHVRAHVVQIGHGVAIGVLARDARLPDARLEQGRDARYGVLAEPVQRVLHRGAGRDPPPNRRPEEIRRRDPAVPLSPQDRYQPAYRPRAVGDSHPRGGEDGEVGALRLQAERADDRHGGVELRRQAGDRAVGRGREHRDRQGRGDSARWHVQPERCVLSLSTVVRRPEPNHLSGRRVPRRRLRADRSGLLRRPGPLFLFLQRRERAGPQLRWQPAVWRVR